MSSRDGTVVATSTTRNIVAVYGADQDCLGVNDDNCSGPLSSTRYAKCAGCAVEGTGRKVTQRHHCSQRGGDDVICVIGNVKRQRGIVCLYQKLADIQIVVSVLRRQG